MSSNLKTVHFFKRFVLWPLLFVLLVLVISWGGFYELSEKSVLLHQQNQTLIFKVTQTIREIRFLQDQERLFNQYGAEYENIISKGLVKDFDRVKWTDGLLKIHDQLLLSDFVIQFEPEIKLEKNNFKHYRPAKDIFYFTKMNIQFGMVIDTDIIRLTDLMAQQISPFYMIDKCHISVDDKKIGVFDFDFTKPNFNTQCSFIVFQAKPQLLKKGG